MAPVGFTIYHIIGQLLIIHKCVSSIFFWGVQLVEGELIWINMLLTYSNVLYQLIIDFVYNNLHNNY